MTRILLVALLLPLPALAHDGDHSGAGWFHLLTEPDHLAMVAAAIGAAWLLRRWVRR